ncbi:TauD/TfdA family dioxygenase [Streptomyces sp. M19]
MRPGDDRPRAGPNHRAPNGGTWACRTNCPGTGRVGPGRRTSGGHGAHPCRGVRAGGARLGRGALGGRAPVAAADRPGRVRRRTAAGGRRQPGGLDRVAASVGGGLLEYTERSTPRSRVSGRVYTSTEYPAAQPIVQHNENAYSHSFPHWLFFAALETATTGGETRWPTAAR